MYVVIFGDFLWLVSGELDNIEIRKFASRKELEEFLDRYVVLRKIRKGNIEKYTVSDGVLEFDVLVVMCDNKG